EGAVDRRVRVFGAPIVVAPAADHDRVFWHADLDRTRRRVLSSTIGRAVLVPGVFLNGHAGQSACRKHAQSVVVVKATPTPNEVPERRKDPPYPPRMLEESRPYGRDRCSHADLRRPRPLTLRLFASAVIPPAR